MAVPCRRRGRACSRREPCDRLRESSSQPGCQRALCPGWHRTARSVGPRVLRAPGIGPRRGWAPRLAGWGQLGRHGSVGARWACGVVGSWARGLVGSWARSRPPSGLGGSGLGFGLGRARSRLGLGVLSACSGPAFVLADVGLGVRAGVGLGWRSDATRSIADPPRESRSDGGWAEAGPRGP